MSKPEEESLRGLSENIYDAGRLWISAKLISDQLEDGEKNYLAALMNEIERAQFEGQKVSDTKLERMARGTPEFGDYVKRKCEAVAETGKRKVRYEALQNYFEARRSELAFDRAKIEKGIYHEGS